MITLDDPLDFFSFANLGVARSCLRIEVVPDGDEESKRREEMVFVSVNRFAKWLERLLGIPEGYQDRECSKGVESLGKPDVLILNGVFDLLSQRACRELLSRPDRFVKSQLVIWRPYEVASWGDLYSQSQFWFPIQDTRDLASKKVTNSWEGLCAGWDRLCLRTKGPASDVVAAEFAFYTVMAPSDFSYSVIIPHFNHWQVVEDAIRSIEVAASGCRCEIIFVDDHSTDPGQPIASGIAQKNVFLPVNKGVSGALNAGIDAADGDFICWLSADDLYLENFFRLRNFVLRHRSDLDLLYSECLVTQFGTNRFSRMRRNVGDLAMPRLLADLVFNNGVSGITWTMGRTELADLRFDLGNRHAQDAKMWFALAMRGLRSASLPIPTAVTRFLGTNYSQIYPDICSVEAVIGVLDVAMKEPTGKLTDPEFGQYLDRLHLNLVKSLGMSAWDYPKGLAVVRALAALFVMSKIAPIDWQAHYCVILRRLEDSGVTPDRLTLLSRWKTNLLNGNALASLRGMVKQAFSSPADSRPRIAEEFALLKNRHPEYFTR